MLVMIVYTCTETGEAVSRYNILSIDGGGVNVLMSLLLLRRLEAVRPGFLAACDLFVGTSAGGISAMMLAAEDDPATGLDKAIRFWEKSPKFVRRARHAVASFVGTGALYSNSSLRRELQRILRDKKLKDLPHKVLVASVQLDSKASNPAYRSWRPRSLSNLDVEGGAYLEGLAIDIALRSAAAPMIWPVYQGYVDGGLFANDPSMLALTRVLDERRNHSTPGGHARDVLVDISLFSVGEGQVPHYIQAGTENWGYRQWLLHPRRQGALLELALNSTAEAISEQCRMLLGDHQFYRLNPDSKPLTGRTMHVFDPIPFARSRLQHATASIEELINPLHAALAHARSVAGTYNLDPASSWVDDSGWMDAGTVTAPTPA
jgi:patatin-like phospholipase/acyl hydrolase